MEHCAWSTPDDTRLAESDVAEIDVMLAAAGVDPKVTEGITEDINYPYEVRSRIRGQVSEGILWLAACHGLARGSSDSGALYLSHAEYRGLPGCYGP